MLEGSKRLTLVLRGGCRIGSRNNWLNGRLRHGHPWLVFSAAAVLHSTVTVRTSILPAVDRGVTEIKIRWFRFSGQILALNINGGESCTVSALAQSCVCVHLLSL